MFLLIEATKKLYGRLPLRPYSFTSGLYLRRRLRVAAMHYLQANHLHQACCLLYYFASENQHPNLKILF
jgi:hypothetical protein